MPGFDIQDPSVQKLKQLVCLINVSSLSEKEYILFGKGVYMLEEDALHSAPFPLIYFDVVYTMIVTNDNFVIMVILSRN